MTLGKKIKQLRENKNYSQEELADLLKVHSVTISKWENGTQEPRAKRLSELAKALNTSVEYLMGLTDDAPPETQISLPIDNMEKENNVDMAYWGGVLDNMRRLAKSETNPSDIALITAMLKSGIEELSNSKINRTQSAGVVMNNMHGDNMNVNVNNK